MQADVCIVCAEPLQYTAFGECGHKDACSRCVVRLRAVLKDDRCLYCQQRLEKVFVTRYAGEFTRNVSLNELDKDLQDAASGEIYYLPNANAYFDDKEHFEAIRRLSSFSHPLLGPKCFHSLKALKNALQTRKKLEFCDICLEGRKVFVSEQIAYTRTQLERHQRSGDEEGPLKESGFKGHPECRFCKKRFYGENELYTHMHTSHEECFICRRMHPNRHVYYRHYTELEDHFHREHFPCEQTECLEKKFVVFPTEQELKTHMAREHKDLLSRTERKAALTLPVAFKYSRGDEGNSRGKASERSNGSSTDLAGLSVSGRSAIVIGGAASIPSQLSQTARREQPVSSASSSAELGSSSQHSIAINEVEFPSITSEAGSGPMRGGQWVGSRGQSSNQNFSVEEFPALPGTSKSARRRANKAKSAASKGLELSRNKVENGLGVPRQLRKAPSTQELRDPGPSQPERGLQMRRPSAECIDKSFPNAALAGSGAGVSKALREANRVLIGKIKEKLGDDKKFDVFRKDSADWLNNKLSSEQYHLSIIELGLASLVPELAATCPDETRRRSLLDAHSSAFNDSNPINNLGSWVPPEVAALQSKAAASNSSWTCSMCTLVNAPGCKLCEACGHFKSSAVNNQTLWKSLRQSSNASSSNKANQKQEKVMDDLESDFPALSISSGSASTQQGTVPDHGENSKELTCSTSSAVDSGHSKKKGKKKVSKSTSLQSFMKATPAVHPQNIWKNPNLRGSWAAVDKLAKEERALKDAWEKKN